MPNGFLVGKTVGIRFLFFYVTQLVAAWKNAPALAVARAKLNHVTLSIAEIIEQRARAQR